MAFLLCAFDDGVESYKVHTSNLGTITVTGTKTITGITNNSTVTIYKSEVELTSSKYTFPVDVYTSTDGGNTWSYLDYLQSTSVSFNIGTGKGVKVGPATLSGGGTPTYDTNFIYLRCGLGINSYRVSYQNLYDNTVSELISSSNSSTTCAVRSNTNLSVHLPNFSDGYGEPYYIVEYTDNTFKTIKKTFDVSDHNVYSNGMRYIIVKGTPTYRYRIHANAQEGTFDDTKSEYWYPSKTGWKTSSEPLPNFDLSNIPVPKRTGYKFLGWRKTLDSQATIYPSTHTITITATTEGKINNLYATWEIRPHIILDANGGKFEGTLDVKDFYINNGDFLYLSRYKPSWYGEGSYSLIGWLEESTGKTWGVDAKPGPFKTVGPHRYYAVWQKSKVNITFNGNGGLWGGNLQQKSKIYEVGDVASFAPFSEGLIRAGYTLLGWSASKTATLATYEINGIVQVGATDANYYAVWSKYIKPFYWYDDNETDNAKIATGQPISNLTAEIWNNFKQKINEVTIAKTGTNWTYSKTNPGDTITAKEVQEAREAILLLNRTASVPSLNLIKKDKQVLARIFNGEGSLKAALNTIITNYNK